MNTNIFKLIGIGVIVGILAVGYTLYKDSVENDFKNISRAEHYRMADHYTGFYHRPSCPKLKQTYNGGKRYESSEAARIENYAPCDRCEPDAPDVE